MTFTVLWDNDGVLVDTEGIYFRATREVLASIGIDLTPEQFREISLRRGESSLTPSLKDSAYRDHVFAYIEKEDTPRPLVFQLELLRQVGFTRVDVLHKTCCFAAFGAIKD